MSGTSLSGEVYPRELAPQRLQHLSPARTRLQCMSGTSLSGEVYPWELAPQRLQHLSPARTRLQCLVFLSGCCMYMLEGGESGLYI